ncbi:MAG TPA: hypothetical protein VIG24_10115 [Acidimicrobiia bacterium]
MKYRVTAPFNGLKVGARLDASDLAGCNMAMLRARGVLVPVTKKAPARPVETADEPEEQ